MEKTTYQKTAFSTRPLQANAVPPTGPEQTGRIASEKRTSDPSSTFRSNRYPVPTVDYRMHPAT